MRIVIKVESLSQFLWDDLTIFSWQKARSISSFDQGKTKRFIANFTRSIKEFSPAASLYCRTIQKGTVFLCFFHSTQKMFDYWNSMILIISEGFCCPRMLNSSTWCLSRFHNKLCDAKFRSSNDVYRDHSARPRCASYLFAVANYLTGSTRYNKS